MKQEQIKQLLLEISNNEIANKKIEKLKDAKDYVKYLINLDYAINDSMSSDFYSYTQQQVNGENLRTFTERQLGNALAEIEGEFARLLKKLDKAIPLKYRFTGIEEDTGRMIVPVGEFLENFKIALNMLHVCLDEMVIRGKEIEDGTN